MAQHDETTVNVEPGSGVPGRGGDSAENARKGGGRQAGANDQQRDAEQHGGADVQRAARKRKSAEAGSHQPQKPKVGSKEWAREMGRNAKTTARRAGFQSMEDNPLTRLLKWMANLLGDLLRRVFGRITSKDLQQEREAKKQDLQAAHSELDSLAQEKERLKRDLKNEQEDLDRTDSNLRHAQLLSAAQEIKNAAAESRRAGETHEHATPQLGTFSHPPGFESGTGVEEGVYDGINAYLEGEVDHARLYCKRTLQDILRVATEDQNCLGFSRPTVAEAGRYAQTIREAAEGISDDGLSAAALASYVTCMAYLEEAAANIQGSGYAALDRRELARLIDERVKDFGASMAESGLPPEAWVGVITDRTQQAIDRLGSRPVAPSIASLAASAGESEKDAADKNGPPQAEAPETESNGKGPGRNFGGPPACA